MAETAILFAKPKAVSPSDKAKLRKINVVVVEVDSLDDVKLVYPERAGAELAGGDILFAAATALKDHQFAREAFGRSLAELIINSRQERSDA